MLLHAGDGPSRVRSSKPSGAEAPRPARERIDPIEQGVFGVFSERDLAVFRELLSRFIDAFDKA